jgi:hypothetical protein
LAEHAAVCGCSCASAVGQLEFRLCDRGHFVGARHLAAAAVGVVGWFLVIGIVGLRLILRYAAYAWRTAGGDQSDLRGDVVCGCGCLGPVVVRPAEALFMELRTCLQGLPP